MKKQKSSTIVLTVSSSDDESEKAMPKIDKRRVEKIS